MKLKTIVRRNLEPLTTSCLWFYRTLLNLTIFAAFILTQPTAIASASTNSHWAFQPVSSPTPPKVQAKGSVRAPIDNFILAKLEQRHLQLAPPADKRTLLRRATFDLTGLPPTPVELDAFMADSSADAFAKVIERLLASPHYGEHWGRHWLDVVRYADTAGETADYPVPVAWRYRNYVIDAFNADKPYDEFLREQIAGDILAQQGPSERYAERVTATGYLAISRRFGFDSENYHHLTIQDTIDTLGQSVLGLSLGCARCHDHKYDPIPMTDYYALYGIFDSTRYAFPGSEQKQKYRSMVPLKPSGEATSNWHDFDERIAALIRKLDRNKQSPPAAVLRSLADMDGDFEMQAIAAGGSRGVLVPPWVYEGGISVTREAQSPFGNLYPLGKAGATLPSGTNKYQFGQALYPHRTHETGGKLYINLDSRIATNSANTNLVGHHRFWMGSRMVSPSPMPALESHPGAADQRQPGSDASKPQISPAFEFLISSHGYALRNSHGEVETLAEVEAGTWHNLQLVLDLSSRTFSGEIRTTNSTDQFTGRHFLTTWNGSLNYLGMESVTQDGAIMPGMDIDNIGIREAPILSLVASSERTGAKEGEPTLPALNEQLKSLVGLDGDFELQSANSPPDKPWEPGPKSAVKILAQSQSPYQHIHGRGELGVRLPAGAAYNGFGQTLTNTWKAATNGQLHASFDFRYTLDEPAPGSWRYYLGHGAGTSPAIELFISDGHLVQRSGDIRSTVASLRSGEWYQVQLTLNLKDKTYAGWIGTPSEKSEFHGATAHGWDGSIDHTFIDSYGHIAGAKPVLDSDNFTVNEMPLPGFEATVPESSVDIRQKRENVASIRRQRAALQAELDQARQELNAALAEGPADLAYAVMEGSPRNARIHLRGEQDKPGAEVPRGFIKAIGGEVLPPATEGSGRLELAHWITRPGNPLTARVMVNRIWQYHFGRGLVETPNDFGVRGQLPTHPELLDHLAGQFIASGWSIKAMHRLIMGSATYQQAGEMTSDEIRMTKEDLSSKPQAVGSATNRGSVSGTSSTFDIRHSDFSPFPRRRLTAEETRDSILFVSGELDRKPGRGHSFPSPTSWGFTQHGPFSALYDHNKRSVYLMSQRIKRHPFLALFDGPDPNTSTATRSVSTVPTQALYFMNAPFVHEKSSKFAARLEKTSPSESEQITLAYQWALGRTPDELEKTDIAEFLAAYRSELGAKDSHKNASSALAAFTRVIMGSNEFLHVD